MLLEQEKWHNGVNSEDFWLNGTHNLQVNWQLLATATGGNCPARLLITHLRCRRCTLERNSHADKLQSPVKQIMDYVYQFDMVLSAGAQSKTSTSSNSFKKNHFPYLCNALQLWATCINQAPLGQPFLNADVPLPLSDCRLTLFFYYFFLSQPGSRFQTATRQS